MQPLMQFCVGTMLSGFSAFCCGKSRMHSRENNLMRVCWVNVMVGTMQFFTVTLLLVGWAWSLVWGIYMVILAGKQSPRHSVMRRPLSIQLTAAICWQHSTSYEKFHAIVKIKTVCKWFELFSHFYCMLGIWHNILPENNQNVYSNGT